MAERNQAKSFLSELVRALVLKKADALHLSPMLPPTLFIDGKSVPLTGTVLKGHHTREMCLAVMPPELQEEFESNNKCNFEIAGSDLALGEMSTFHVNVWRIQSDFSLTIDDTRHKKSGLYS